MDLSKLPANMADDAANALTELDVVIEIAAHSPPVKYEAAKATGMRYSCNYGFVTGTHAKDGDRGALGEQGLPQGWRAMACSVSHSPLPGKTAGIISNDRGDSRMPSRMHFRSL